MDGQQFAYWLQGFAELHEEPPTAAQWQSIREHLGLVFNKVTPPVGQPAPGLDPEIIRRLMPRDNERGRRPARDIIRCSADISARALC